jgi:hypothetical protein
MRFRNTVVLSDSHSIGNLDGGVHLGVVLYTLTKGPAGLSRFCDGSQPFVECRLSLKQRRALKQLKRPPQVPPHRPSIYQSGTKVARRAEPLQHPHFPQHSKFLTVDDFKLNLAAWPSSTRRAGSTARAALVCLGYWLP